MTALYISDPSLPENAIPEHQQINLFAGQHCIYFNVNISNLTLLQDGTAII